MRNYIHADLRRIFRRIPRVIVLALLYGIIAYAVGDTLYQNNESQSLLIIFEHYVIGFFPLVVGLIELAITFSDDFHAKTMQQAIGMGISRNRIVLCKLTDMAILMLVDLFVFGAMVTVAAGVVGAGNIANLEFTLSIVNAWIKSVAYASLSMTIAFYLQNALYSMMIYIALSTGVVGKLLGLLFQVKFVTSLHLERFLLTAEADKFYTHALLGYFDFGALFAVLIYIASGIAISAYLFNSVELEL